MIIVFHKFFSKKLKKLTKKERSWVNDRIKIFIQDEQSPVLNNHALHGRYFGCRSINISGDLRAIYKMQDENIALFVDIDIHSNLYR